MKPLRVLAVVTAVCAWALVALSPLVRITGSGMGCGDHWPLCNGKVIPDFVDLTVAIEWGHRVAALAFGFLMLALVALAWARRAVPGVGGPGGVLGPALLALVFLVPQGLLGRLAVKTELQYLVVVAHWTAALALLALVVVAALRAFPPPAGVASARARRGALAAAAVGFLALVLGGLVANLNAGFACQGFPLCNGRLWPASAPGGLAHLHWMHRLVAYLLFLHLAALPFLFRRRGEPKGVSQAAALAFGVLLVHVIVAVMLVLQGMPLSLRAAHAALGALVWVGLVGLAWRTARPSVP